MRPITRTITIARPPDLVARQFADVPHHERAGVHSSTAFQLLSDDDETVHYIQRSKIGPRTAEQTVHLDRRDPYHLINTFTDGPFAGSTLTFDIEAFDEEAARVTATLTPSKTALTRLLGPLLTIAIKRDLTAALDEDRQDLESGNYPNT